MPRHPDDTYGPVITGNPLPESSPSSPAAAPGSAFDRLRAKASDMDDDPFLDPADPVHDIPAAKESEHAARLWMTAMKLFSPLVSAVVAGRAVSYSPDALMEDFFTLLRATNTLSADLAKWLNAQGGLDFQSAENRWVLRQIVPLVAQSVAEQWRKHGVIDTKITGSLYQAALSTLSRQGAVDPDRFDLDNAFLEAAHYDDRFIRIPAQEAVMLSQLNALQPVISELALFSAWQDPGDLAGDLATILGENAEYLYQLHDDRLLTPRSRLVLLQACIKHSGHMLHDAFRIHARELMSRYESLPDAERERFPLRFKDGAPESRQWLSGIAQDARQRCRILNEAALAGRRALDTLLKTHLPNPAP